MVLAGGNTDHGDQGDDDKRGPKGKVLVVEKVPLLTKQYLQNNGGLPRLRNITTINVSGRRFLIDKCFLEQYPSTLLGSDEKEQYWDPRYNEYFFEVHREAFESIFDFYLYGKLYPHPHVPNPLHQEVVEFFKIMSVFDAEEADEREKEMVMQSLKTWDKVKEKVHKTLEDPSLHVLGRVYGWADLIFICLSIITMLIETIPAVHAASDRPGSWEGKMFKILETITVVFFTCDVLLRLSVHPDRMLFMKSPATWLDILTVAPFFVEIFIDFSKLESMKVLRIARVARVLKLIKKNKRLQLIADVLMKSVSEILMLVIVWAMNVTVVLNRFYLAQYGVPSPTSHHHSQYL
eukprot:sb/3466246/